MKIKRVSKSSQKLQLTAPKIQDQHFVLLLRKNSGWARQRIEWRYENRLLTFVNRRWHVANPSNRLKYKAS